MRVMAPAILAPSAIFGSADTTEHVQGKNGVCGEWIFYLIASFGLQKGEGSNTNC